MVAVDQNVARTHGKVTGSPSASRARAMTVCVWRAAASYLGTQSSAPSHSGWITVTADDAGRGRQLNETSEEDAVEEQLFHR